MLEQYSVTPSGKYEPAIIQYIVSGVEDYNQLAIYLPCRAGIAIIAACATWNVYYSTAFIQYFDENTCVCYKGGYLRSYHNVWGWCKVKLSNLGIQVTVVTIEIVTVARV